MPSMGAGTAGAGSPGLPPGCPAPRVGARRGGGRPSRRAAGVRLPVVLRGQGRQRTAAVVPARLGSAPPSKSCKAGRRDFSPPWAERLISKRPGFCLPSPCRGLGVHWALALASSAGGLSPQLLQHFPGYPEIQGLRRAVPSFAPLAVKPQKTSRSARQKASIKISAVSTPLRLLVSVVQPGQSPGLGS